MIFFFFIPVEFFSSVSERSLGTEGDREIIHELCLRFAMVPIFVPFTMDGYYLKFSPLINIWDCSDLKLIKLHICQGHAFGHGSSVIDT